MITFIYRQKLKGVPKSLVTKLKLLVLKKFMQKSIANKICYCCSVTQSCLTLCDPKICGMPGLPVPHHLLNFPQVHVHCIGDAIHPSHPLMPSSSALNLSQHQGHSNELAVCIRRPKCWNFSFTIRPFNE